MKNIHVFLLMPIIFNFFMGIPTNPYLKKDNLQLISSKSLYKLFDENEEIASATFNDKMLLVEGKVVDFIDNNGHCVIFLDTSVPYYHIQCHLKKCEKFDGEIMKGNKVKLTGKCKGFIVDVILMDCKLEH